MPPEPASLQPIPRPAPEIPGYTIESVIGRGATGVVYRARQLAVDREVALKVIHPELCIKPRVIQRLQREARTTARLAHPHIVSAIDMGETRGLWWFAMELVDGPSLALRLRQEGRLHEREALRLFIQLAEALAHTHENGVVHRDIKPANILIDRAGGARLADLGLAFAENDPSLTGSEGTLGTPHYISPEQARDPSQADIQSDIWSLGATFFHALCGRPPFSGTSLAEVLSAVLYGAVPDPQSLEPELSRGLALVLRKCLSRDPELRYQTPQELLADLERVRERRRPKVRTGALEPSEGSWPKWIRGALIAGGVLLLLIVAWLVRAEPWKSKLPAPYAPLEALAASVDGPADKLAGAWESLMHIEPEVPPAQIARWRELRKGLRERLNEELSQVQGEIEARIESPLARGDSVEARRILERELGSLLSAHTGFQLAHLPGEFRGAVDALEGRVLQTQVALVQALGGRLALWFDDELLREVERLQAAQHWREARALLERSGPEMAEAAGAEVEGLPVEALKQPYAKLTERLAQRHAALEQSWLAVDVELAGWIAARSGELMLELTRGGRVGASSGLRADFKGELARRGIEGEQALLELGVARMRLEEGAKALFEQERSLRAGRDDDDLDALQMLAGWLADLPGPEAWLARDYENLEPYWNERLSDMGALGEAQSSSLRLRLSEQLELRLREVRLLRRLLEQAVLGAQQLAKEDQSEFYVRHIRVEGKLRVPADALESGCLLDTPGDRPDYLLRLRPERSPRAAAPGPARGDRPIEVVLDAGQIGALAARVAAASGADAAATADAFVALDAPLVELACALLRAREGDPEGALAQLEARPASPPREPELEQDLRERCSRSLQAERARLAAHEAEAQELLTRLDSPGAATDAERGQQQALLAQLLSGYADVPAVQQRWSELKARRAELERGTSEEPRLKTEEDWRTAFGAAEASLPAAGRVRLAWRLDGPAAGRVEPGDWRPDGSGWAASESARNWDDFLVRRGPSLLLEAPLDADLGSVEVVLDLSQPRESGRPRLLIVSLAGVHCALAGPGLVSDEQKPGYLITTGSLESLLARLQQGVLKPRETLLSAGVEHEVRIELKRRQGQVRLEVDGVLVDRLNFAYGQVRDARPELRISSWEPVRLIGLSVSAGRR